MAIDAHVEILKQGVDAWNSWRSHNPNIQPDLSRFDFSSKDNLEGSSIWGSPFWAKQGRARALLEGIDFHSTNLLGCRFDSADLRSVNFKNADLSWANFSRVEMHLADVTSANLTMTRWENANVSEIRYDRRLLSGRCYGASSVSSSFGNSSFRRDVIDQDYIDTKFRDIAGEYPKSHFSVRPVAYVHSFLIALLAGLWRHPGLALLGMLLTNVLFLLNATPDPHTFSDFVSGSSSYISTASPETLLAATAIGLIVGVLLGSWFFKRFLLTLWSIFDYGRNISRVIAFAFALILAFGFAYTLFDGDLLFIKQWGTNCEAGKECLENAFYPWYVAAMGFCTLGISDMVVPKNGLGMLVIMLNVLSGFTTLGLLLAVLSDQFARRA